MLSGAWHKPVNSRRTTACLPTCALCRSQGVSKSAKKQQAADLANVALSAIGVLNFWRALPRAIEDGDSCLTLTDDTWLMGDAARGNRIYIRSCYRELKVCIDALVAGGTRRVVITGTPGIGKSCYAFYWLWHLRRAGAAVVYQLGSEFY